MIGTPSERDPFDELAEEFLARYRAGERPTVGEYAQRFPALAGQIRRLLPALVVMEELRPGEEKSSPTPSKRRPGDGPVPERLGEYLILREIGRGGMGVVYEAVQESLGRHVALKVLPFNSLVSPMQLERFQREARAAARLHHSNIVPVFGIGEHEGIHYYAMQFIPGHSLDTVLQEVRRLRDIPAAPGTENQTPVAKVAEGLLTGQFADHHPTGARPIAPVPVSVPAWSSLDRRTPIGAPSPDTASAPSTSELGRHGERVYFRSVAEIGQRVAEALSYAHQQGIVHRDIKPSNLLLDTTGTVWITDFGLAKSEGAIELTSPGDIVGTVAYMAPERFRGESLPASDVYGLGMTLYELLCLRPAFASPDRVRLMELITHEDPQPPRSADALISKDLETICLKALAKEPDRRYSSAGAMAEDLRRFLNGEPIRARRVGRGERLWRWARRNPALATASGVAASALSAAAALAVCFAFYQYQVAAQLRNALADAQSQRREADGYAGHLALDRGLLLCEQGDVGHGLLWLAHSLTIATRAEDADLEHAIRANLAGWSALLAVPRQTYPHEGPILAVAFRPDGQAVLTGSHDHTAQLWEAASGRPIGQPFRHQDFVGVVAFSPDGQRALTASFDGTARLWDAATGQAGAVLRHEHSVTAAAFSPDGQRVLTGSQDRTAQLWEAATGNRLGPPLRHGDIVWAVAFSPDGRTLVTGSEDRTARLWDAATGMPLSPPLQHEDGIKTMAFSADGRRVLTGSKDRTARLWDTATGESQGPALQHQGAVWFVAFSPDGRTMLTGSDDRTARLWDAATGRPVGLPLPHQGQVKTGAFSPDGRIAVTGSNDRTARLWDAATGEALGPPLPHVGWVLAVAFAPDGGSMMVGGGKAAVRWELPVRRPPAPFLHHDALALAVSYRADGSAILTASGDRTAQLWEPTMGRPLGPPLLHPDRVWAAVFSPDGRTVLTGGVDHTARLWDAANGNPVGDPLRHEGPVRAVAFHPDGQTVITGSEDQTARLWELSTGKPLGAPLVHKHHVYAVAFSPDGQCVLTASGDGTARLWDTATGQPRGGPLPHQGWVLAAAFSPDGRTILTGGQSRSAQQWDAATGLPRGLSLAHQDSVSAVAFSPDDRTLLTGSYDSTARLWDAATGKPIGPRCRAGSPVHAVAFRPDGRVFLTACRDGTVRAWPVPAPQEGAPEWVKLWAEVLTVMEMEGGARVKMLDAEAWSNRRWRLEGLPSDGR
jgi:WD40 repeat protein/serine/threonine protein kinase